MDQEELSLYEAFGNYAIDNLFWSLVYLNNASFNTPMKEECKNKLLSLNKTYELIIMSIYPAEKGKNLIEAMANNNRLFISYIEHLLEGSNQTGAFKQRWKENGMQIAMLLNKLNPHWKVPEWSAMIQHETDLLETIATNLRAKNYTTFVNTAPICRRLAVDMSKYMSSGVILQQGDTW